MEKLSEPLVSVLMTAYNREKFVGKAIESVLASTYVNFELIIVDDCSQDRTVHVLRSFEERDSRIKVYANKKNLGDYPNRNEAARRAQGKYLKYVDSDDLIYPHALAVFVSCLEQYPTAALCVGSNQLQGDNPFPLFIPRQEVLREHFFGVGILNSGPTGVMIRTDAFRKLGGFTGRRMIGDTELWFSLACQYDVVVAPPSLVFWRKHEGQEFIDGVQSGLYAESNLELINELVNKVECPLSSDERRRIVTHYRKVASRHLLKLVLTKGHLSKAFFLNKQFGLKISDYFNGLFNIRKGII